MVGGKKSTKKFVQKRLPDVLERRKAHAKIKQRHQLNDKRKEKSAARRAEAEAAAAAAENPEELKKQNAFSEMNVDDFFAGGFDIPEDKGKKASKKDTTPKIGKRKRSEDKAQADAEASEGESDDDSVDAYDEHKDQLESLKDKDPEFYKYLKENDSELLEFGDQGDLSEVDALSESEEPEDEEPAKKKKKKSKKEEEPEEETEDETLTIEMVKKWQKLMEEQNSIRAMRQAVLAFRAAAYVNDPDAPEQKYTISDKNVYHQVLITALNTIPKVLAHHLPVKESASGKIRVSLDSKKFKTLTPLIKSHTASVHQLLVNLSDASTLKLTLASIEPMLPYLLQFRKVLKTLVKIVVGIWADVSTADATRITGFLILRRLMVLGDAGIRESVLKATYEGVVKGSRNTTVHTLAGVNLMKNSAAEIWGIDQNVSYTAGFSFIRQLAMHLRKSITNTSKESYKTIYNWQYVHSLDFWSRVLSQHCDGLVEAQVGKQSALRPLIYPVVQITLGAMRLIPTATYFPLRFQLTRSLLRISRATGTYIPLSASLLEVLTSAEMRKHPKSSTLKPLDFNTAIRAPKSYLRSRTYQDGIGEQVAELLSEFFVLWSKHIAFPELSVPVVVSLKRWLKQVSARSGGNKNAKINQMILLLVQKVETNARWIEERRMNVSYAPRNRSAVESFLKDVDWETTPVGAFVKTQRKLREERAAVLEEGRIEEEKRRQEAKKNGGEDEDMGGVAGSDDGSEDEEELESEEEAEIESEDEDEMEMEDE
ncbi:Ribosome assembly protein Noc2, putative [Penicillium digitatum]|uniref:Ribosome assembly protein Noc2, putative n=3 Tax=Penicillium digitatum TaxID=36651 RepID=K9H1D8_PEND2|nr:Ribosome assembly protein Noc2, putative [Penicillium digitatum Pd1]EKV18901.1 Ribosome assembly protein Noc2, putative [Penicillium digitatum PHI26]EKV20911.1 Ribosome assembly protein Noc2, putative [Penicillium digitatum Pd1]QQK48405.1 Ribosome assembly protein Noc2, putative [Penicillium digitatum]